jgi:hypothetical protein
MPNLAYALAYPLHRAHTDFLRRLGGMHRSPAVLVLHAHARLATLPSA